MLVWIEREFSEMRVVGRKEMYKDGNKKRLHSMVGVGRGFFVFAFLVQ